MTLRALGLDIGGANVKVAHSLGPASLQPFELWKNPAGLADVLRNLLARQQAFDCLAVTMTGELCDCFATKREGVGAILDAVTALGGKYPICVWQTDGRLVDVAAAKAMPRQTAAANWLALAEYAGRYLPEGPGLLVDVGSTTTDIVPLDDGRPIPLGRTDLERLRSGELVYTGVRRTPVCALLGSEGAAEWFATTQDVYLLLGWLPEDPADGQTADSRPATRAAAHGRLARMLCSDSEGLSETDAMALATRVANLQIDLVRAAVGRVAARLPGPPRGIVVAGSGEFLAREALRGDAAPGNVPILSLAERLSPKISGAACAYALAVLASERLHIPV
jgi:(4-(4-[2-(gamma-L-glutamylamino)ethyl]phenoxymethyl)furan-2-yl)methanamine synthase